MIQAYMDAGRRASGELVRAESAQALDALAKTRAADADGRAALRKMETVLA